MRAAFNEKMREYFDKSAAHAISLGYKPALKKVELKHFEWLVLFHIKGMTSLRFPSTRIRNCMRITKQREI